MNNCISIRKLDRFPFHVLAVFMFFLFGSFSVYAEGSKDLYPSNAKGGRAKLRSSTSATSANPFPTHATHFVYAKAGEQIALASSAQGVNQGRILLYSPNGDLVLNETDEGQIVDRVMELAGPRLSTQSVGGYVPTRYMVPKEGAGVYRVEIYSGGSNNNAVGPGYRENIMATDYWAQGDHSMYISAWDISVESSGKWVKGRVYMNVLNMDIYTIRNDVFDYPSTKGFYGVFKVLTKDGFIYNVDNNGNNGISFTFLVNNKGFYDRISKQPLYKSINDGDAVAAIIDQVHDPRAADTESDITHKIFYNLPDPLMPKTSVAANANGSTWLKNERILPTVDNVSVIGADGTIGQVSTKGGRITFKTNNAGTFRITIQSDVLPKQFTTRIIEGQAIAGNNSVIWDGKDGDGKQLPTGNVPATVSVQLQGAEVHFPYLDMELNPHGIKLQLLNHDLTGVQSDIVYWDDSDINKVGVLGNTSNPINNSHKAPTNSAGISSLTNGHKWGGNTNSLTKSFGDNKGMDTWTFILGERADFKADISVKITDLSVGIIASKTSVKAGDEITYTVKVKNSFHPNDPDRNVASVEKAPFALTIPTGFVPKVGGITFSAISSCGTQATALNFDPANNKYVSTLNLGVGCEITYTMTGTITSAMQSGNGGRIAEATILRPNDVTDYDATNTDLNTRPTDPKFECANNGMGGKCNNISSTVLKYIPNVDLKVTKTVNNKQISIGEDVVFTIVVENLGPDNATNVSVEELWPGGLTFKESTPSNGTYSYGSSWMIGNLAKGAKATLTIRTTAALGGNQTNTATATSTEEELKPSDNTSSVTVLVCQAGIDQVGLTGGTLKN